MSEPRPAPPAPPLAVPGRHAQEPGERAPAAAARRLDRPPSSRYETNGVGLGAARPTSVASARPAWLRPFVVLVACVGGAAAIVLLVGVLATTTGLLIVAGAIGLAVGSQVGPRPATALAVAAVAAGDVATWLYARTEGGVLGLPEYLLAVFCAAPIGQVLVATLTAWWSSGRLRSRS